MRLVFVSGTLVCVAAWLAGCAGSESRAAKSSAPDAARGDAVLVAEPGTSETAANEGEPHPAEQDTAFAQPPVDLATLPPGPVTCADCGPAPGYPSWACSDGVHHGGRGPCVKLSDGRCGWINLVCPAQKSSSACTPSECGASPVPDRWRCPDEEHSGAFECVRSDDGRCGWSERPCLGRANVRPGPPPAPSPPPPTRAACDPLPSDRELRTWDVTSICQPGGGPVQPERRLVLSLGDGTHIFEDARGCFRARYQKCLSK